MSGKVDGQLLMTAISSGNCIQGYFITAVTCINNLAQRYEGGCEFPEAWLPIMILVRGSGQNQDSLIYLECGRWRNGSQVRSGKKSVSEKRGAKENRKQEKNNGAKKRKTVSFLCLVNCY